MESGNIVNICGADSVIRLNDRLWNIKGYHYGNNIVNSEQNSTDNVQGSTTIGGLESLLKAQGDKGFPPVDQWDPPYCGDIGLKIDVNGGWSYQGSPIGRKPLVKLFASVLRRDTDGRHYLVTPVEKIDVTVADAPFCAVELEIQQNAANQKLVFRTNVDDIVCCGPDNPLRFQVDSATEGLKPYLLVRGRLEALVSRALYYDLVELAVITHIHGRDQLGVWSDGVFFAMSDAVDLNL